MAHYQQPHYQPVVYCTYWSVLGNFNNWNTAQVKNKTSIEEFDEVYKVVFDGISANVTLLVQTGKYGAINTVDTTTMVFYIVKYVSDTFTLQ